MVPCWNKIILGLDSRPTGLKFFKIILFSHGTTALVWNFSQDHWSTFGQMSFPTYEWWRIIITSGWICIYWRPCWSRALPMIWWQKLPSIRATYTCIVSDSQPNMLKVMHFLPCRIFIAAVWILQRCLMRYDVVENVSLHSWREWPTDRRSSYESVCYVACLKLSWYSFANCILRES